MKHINFLKNWNNKLGCEVITTIRLFDSVESNEVVDICLQKNFYRKGIVLDKRYFKIDEIPEITAYLDAGLSKEELIKLIKQIYKNKVSNWNDVKLVIYLIGPYE